MSVWLAWSRTGPSHRSLKVPADHGTTDKRTTLCGIEIGGWSVTVWNPEFPWACKRCVRQARRMGLAPAAIGAVQGREEGADHNPVND